MSDLKWYSFETSFVSLKNQLTEYLKKHNVTKVFVTEVVEVSGAYSYYRFEILTDADGATEINHFLDTVTIYTDGING